MDTQQQIELIEHRELPMANWPGASTLARELARAVKGEVRFDDGARALYATDASNYRQVPLGVVVPRDVDDVVAAIDVCRRFGAPVVSRGGGTSLAGQGCNVAVVLDFSKYVHHLLELDPAQRFARVEPGLVLDVLRARAERSNLTFGPDPATHTHCTLGGMIGNNSCGVHAMMAGCTSANVEELEVLTYDGLRLTVGSGLHEERGGREGQLHQQVRRFIERHREAIAQGFPHIPRRISGYNLPALLEPEGPHLARALVGSEGTLVTVLSAKLRLVPSPPVRALLVLGYPSVFEAADHLEEVIDAKPIGLEGLDDVLIDDMKLKKLHPERVQLLPDGRGWLMAEFGGQTRGEAEAGALALMEKLEGRPGAPTVKLFDDPAEEAIIWKVRESGLGATARVPGQQDTWEGWEDAAVAPAQLGKYLREFRALLDRYGFRAALYGHFGQGCVHTRIPFDLRHRDGVAKFRSFVEEASDLVAAHGGSFSGEHGDGQSRAELLPKMFSPELMRAFEEWKRLWDPSNKMNPGKIVHPYRLDENLRLQGDPKSPPTHFAFPEDHGSFGYATERCVGVGECRRHEGGTMCPSYMVTKEEQHSTRGRARLLFEMVRGETLTEGWKSEAVHEALDLCLACKGCKSDCPVNVDMATYKAEFRSHYYEGRLRPRAAYAFGLIFWWARAASLFPGFVNGLMRLAPVASAVKWLAGVEPKRTLPSFANVTFREWWRERVTMPVSPSAVEGRGARQAVVLWVDTWSNHFEPAVPIAAVEALESAGLEVIVPQRNVCCGRPLYDWGMLDLAKKQLRGVLEALRPALRAGVPIVGLEPSCLSVFRDELPNLFPGDADAKRLAGSSFMLGEFLQRLKGWEPPRLQRKALVQGHCHHKSVLDFGGEVNALEHVGLDAKVLDAGCCGMAGAFGYEQAHYPVSIACAERALLPAVRGAPEDTLIVADGFSCRGQIAQQSHRRALHTAQVLQVARQQGPLGPAGGLPERGYAEVKLRVPRRRKVRNALLLTAAAVGLLTLVRARSRR